MRGKLHFTIFLGMVFAGAAVTRACDYPDNYVFPTTVEILKAAKAKSSFAFLGIVTESVLISNDQEIADETYKLKQKIKVLRVYYGHPPAAPVYDYLVELDPGAACSPIQPQSGEMYYYFESGQVTADEFKKNTNVKPVRRVFEYEREENEKAEQLLRKP